VSVYVSDFTSPTEWQVQHDEAGHGGTIDPATVVYTTDPGGGSNHNFLVITCPMCDSVSTHPVGGGAQPPLVQEMFVRKVNANGCVCPMGKDVQPASTAVTHIKELVTAMDGPERWALDDAALIATLSA
jgi:hypothetical protein